ncbi:hypothetical protein CCMA1212_004235 [Trichoderma ghanense]|uniref:Uncharacterized protein n=1 Tax=Trichoderma ghanense TaxID=65468 RepID=A0ABY2H595_9HYPO
MISRCVSVGRSTNVSGFLVDLGVTTSLPASVVAMAGIRQASGSRQSRGATLGKTRRAPHCGAMEMSHQERISGRSARPACEIAQGCPTRSGDGGHVTRAEEGLRRKKAARSQAGIGD